MLGSLKFLTVAFDISALRSKAFQAVLASSYESSRVGYDVYRGI